MGNADGMKLVRGMRRLWRFPEPISLIQVKPGLLTWRDREFVIP